MSLINDALKKAQRQRAAATAGDGASGPTPVAKRARPLSARTVVLLAGGALVLIMAAVTATIFIITDTPPPPRPTARVTKTKSPAAEPTAPVTVTAPIVTPPAVVDTPVTTPPPSAAATTSSPPAATTPIVKLPVDDDRPASPALATTAPVVPPASPTTASEPAAALTPPLTPASPVATASPPPSPDQAPAPAVTFSIPKPDERIIAFLDRSHVAGIRSSGADSKALMNDRVYRVNDIVDRTLGLKLVKVAPDTLTFEDANGLTYTKTF